jgi:hypothetical protein
MCSDPGYKLWITIIQVALTHLIYQVTLEQVLQHTEVQKATRTSRLQQTQNPSIHHAEIKCPDNIGYVVFLRDLRFLRGLRLWK